MSINAVVLDDNYDALQPLPINNLEAWRLVNSEVRFELYCLQAKNQYPGNALHYCTPKNKLILSNYRLIVLNKEKSAFESFMCTWNKVTLKSEMAKVSPIFQKPWWKLEVDVEMMGDQQQTGTVCLVLGVDEEFEAIQIEDTIKALRWTGHIDPNQTIGVPEQAMLPLPPTFEESQAAHIEYVKR